jgi:hypothetical protein
LATARFLGAVLAFAVGLVAGCGDAPGFTVAVVNSTTHEIRVRASGFEFLDGDRREAPGEVTFVIQPGGSSALPFIRLEPSPGTIWVYSDACELLSTFESDPGTWRIEVDANGPRLEGGHFGDDRLPVADVSSMGCE